MNRPHFPPPLRITAPLLALLFGLVATWFDYRLNLDLDLARHLQEIRQRADSNGLRLARLSERLIASGDVAALKADLESMARLPGLEGAAVIDSRGSIIADTTASFAGSQASESPLAEAAALITKSATSMVQDDSDENAVSGAHPFRIGDNETGWVLSEYDYTAAIAAARIDARTQLRWMASAMALLSVALWAVLHFGFAARLARLSGNVRALGEGRTDAPSLPEGADEVGSLSSAFVAMAAKLKERELDQVRLEREVLEISESERRRIGHDLHDGLGQRLTAASMATNALVEALKTARSTLAPRCEDVGKQIREAISEARSLSHGLAPVTMDDDGLVAALAALADYTARSGSVHCVFESGDSIPPVNAEVAGQIYRIAQEATNNSLKHAAATEIRIGLERRFDELILEVEDDGKGFTEEPVTDGIGLGVMRYRARIIGGTLEIGSAPAGGSRISCRIPWSH